MTETQRVQRQREAETEMGEKNRHVLMYFITYTGTETLYQFMRNAD